jgi:hypothetical protein
MPLIGPSGPDEAPEPALPDISALIAHLATFSNERLIMMALAELLPEVKSHIGFAQRHALIKTLWERSQGERS